MSDNKKHTRYTGLDRRTPRTPPGMATPAIAAPGIAAPGITAPFKTGGRHSAITNDLYNWHSYKNWADKVRGSWVEKK
jgi:hypothetical protein